MINSWVYEMAQKQKFEVHLSKNISCERLQSEIKQEKTLLDLNILKGGNITVGTSSINGLNEH